MEGTIERFDALICSGARRLVGYERRLFVAEVATELCGGSARRAERRFGWGRVTVEKGLHESCSGVRCLENFAARGRLVVKRRIRSWRRTSARLWNPTRKPIRN